MFGAMRENKKRETSKCPICHKLISLSNISRHLQAHNKPLREIEKPPFACDRCGVDKTTKGNSFTLITLRAHKSHCGHNRKYKGWNLGLTKNTDNRIFKHSEKVKAEYAAGKIHNRFGKPQSIEQRRKTSDTITKKINDGTWHLSFSKSRTHEYNGCKFHGTWELEYAKWLDSQNIKWRRPEEKFTYKFDDKIRYYTPDFFLEETKCYVEIKGYPTIKDFAKWDAFPLELKIIPGRKLWELGIIKSFKSRNVKYKNINWK
jgi:hypothetical protein